MILKKELVYFHFMEIMELVIFLVDFVRYLFLCKIYKY